MDRLTPGVNFENQLWPQYWSKILIMQKVLLGQNRHFHVNDILAEMSIIYTLKYFSAEINVFMTFRPKLIHQSDLRGQCSDQFLVGKNGHFLENQCYGQFSA
jgi:hypothetical protein